MKFGFFSSENAFRQEKNLDQGADEVDFDLSQFQMAGIFHVCSCGETLYFTWRQKRDAHPSLDPASSFCHLYFNLKCEYWPGRVSFLSFRLLQFLLCVASENEGNLLHKSWIDQETSHLPQEVTNPNLIQEDKNAF